MRESKEKYPVDCDEKLELAIKGFEDVGDSGSRSLLVRGPRLWTNGYENGSIFNGVWFEGTMASCGRGS